jgi:hypothetical protein
MATRKQAAGKLLLRRTLSILSKAADETFSSLSSIAAMVPRDQQRSSERHSPP